MTAVNVLDIGTASGQNHFKLQWNPDPPPTGTPLEENPASLTEHSPYFVISPEGTAAQFRVSMNGSRTGTYPRTELREMNEAGTSEMAFNTASGDHWLWVPWRVLHLPPVKPTLNVLQLHGGDAEGDRAQVTTELTSGVIKLKFRLNGTSSGQPLLEDPVVLNKWYHTRIRVLDGQIYLYHQDQLIAVVGNITNHSTTAYFKAGCYPNSNDTIDSASEYALMEMGRPMHWHTGWATPKPLVDPTDDVQFVGFRAAGTFVAHASTGPVSPSIPAETVAGDLVLLHVWSVRSSTEPTFTVPAGYVLINSMTRSSGGSVIKHSIYRQVVPVGGLTSPSVSSDGGSGTSAMCSTWTNVDPANPDDVTPPAGTTGASATLTAPSITTVTPGAAVLHIFSQADNSNLGSPSNGTALAYGGTAYDTTTGIDNAHAIAWKTLNPAGASGTTSVTDGTSSTQLDYVAMTIALRPKPVPTDNGDWWSSLLA